MRVVIALFALAAAFLFGAYTVKKETRLYSAMVVVGNWLLEKPAEFNFHRQYVLTEGKKEVACPTQNADTFVIVALGQSNAANHLGQRFTGTDRVVNFFSGKCYAAQDPLLGASGRQGSMWTLLGNQLAAEGKTVVLVPIGVGSVSVKTWADGYLHDLLTGTLTSLKARYTATHFLWHQGEGDPGTAAADYKIALSKVIATTRQFFPESAFFVSVASACRSGIRHEVQRGQMAIVDHGKRVYAGPDTDTLLAIEDRYDGCHFSGVAQEKIADLWLKVLHQFRNSTINPS